MLPDGRTFSASTAKNTKKAAEQKAAEIALREIAGRGLQKEEAAAEEKEKIVYWRSSARKKRKGVVLLDGDHGAPWASRWIAAGWTVVVFVGRAFSGALPPLGQECQVVRPELPVKDAADMAAAFFAGKHVTDWAGEGTEVRVASLDGAWAQIVANLSASGTKTTFCRPDDVHET
jgi:hypothetical protein